MPLSDQIHGPLRPVNKSSKKIGNVSTQYTHIERCRFCYRSILSPKQDLAVILAAAPYSSFDKDCTHLSPDTTDAVLSDDA